MSKLTLFEKWNAPKPPKPPKKKKKDADLPPVPEKPKEIRPFPLTFVGVIPSKRLFEEKKILVVGNGSWGPVLLKEGATRVVSFVSDLPDGRLSDDRRMLVLPMPSGGEFPYPDGYFDTVFLSGALSATEEPEALLAELARITVPAATICIEETPYRSPYGSGLDDVIRMPYGHLLFDKKTIVRGCADAWKDLPEAERKKKMRFTARRELDGTLRFLPKERGMSGGKLKKAVPGNVFITKNLIFRPIEKGICPTLSKIPGVRDFASEKIVMVLEKKTVTAQAAEKKDA